MSWLFLSSPAPRLDGRCPTCGRLALRPEPESGETPARTSGGTWLCSRCGSRCRRRYGERWETVSDVGGVAWLADADPPAAARPRSARFNIRDVMLVIAVLALDFGLLAALPRPANMPGLFVTISGSFLFIGQYLLFRYIKNLRDQGIMV